MKTISTLLVLIISLSTFAQEAGNAGELLKNEAKSNEVLSNNRGEKSNPFPDNSSAGKKPQFKNPQGNTRGNYRWNYNYGNSEVFLRIPENGKFSVEIADQVMSNATGKFRFFDLPAGTLPIAIYANNFLIYRTRVNVKNNSRLVLDFFSDYGLYLLGSYPVRNQSYGINEWDDIWNNPYGNQTENWNGNNGDGNFNNNMMNNQEFNNFLISLKKNAGFDSDKISMISSVSLSINFSSMQVQAMIKEMSFDENRLTVAKKLYQNCVDRRNYFIVYDGFDFDRSRRDLQEYLTKYQ